MVHLKVFCTNTWQDLEAQYNEWVDATRAYIAKSDYTVSTYPKPAGGYGLVYSLCIFYKTQDEMEAQSARTVMGPQPSALSRGLNQKRTLKEASM